MRRRNPDAGLVVFWVKLRQRGYSRSIPGLYRFLRKQGMMAVHPPNPKYIPKPYELMDYPGQRIQVDVKFVPSACLKNSEVIGKKFFQYTAIDEYSRWRFVEAFEKHSTYSSTMFVDHLVKAFPLPIECIQTDNGTEFTNRFTTNRDKPTLFQAHLEQHGIQHKLIRPFTPRHNGKVERSHRKDNERFYATHTFYSFEDFAKQLKVYNRRDYNNFPIRPLGWKSPDQVLKDYLTSVYHMFDKPTPFVYFREPNLSLLPCLFARAFILIHHAVYRLHTEINSLFIHLSTSGCNRIRILDKTGLFFYRLMKLPKSFIKFLRR